MQITFGLHLDSPSWPLPVGNDEAVAGKLHLGPVGLIAQLELRLGIVGKQEDELLRLEVYKNALEDLSIREPFYSSSYKVDPVGTSSFLLKQRDELKISGWDFLEISSTDSRLNVFAILEKKSKLGERSPGFADRFFKLTEELKSYEKIDIGKITLSEPFNLLPLHYKKLFTQLRSNGVEIVEQKSNKKEITDLDLIYNAIISGKNKDVKLKADGSISVLKAENESIAGQFLAKLIKDNSLNPIHIIPDQHPILELKLIQEGIPAMGLKVSSEGFAMLQLIKLAPYFLWDPLDPIKVIEFLTLPYKPINGFVSKLLANEMSERPGIKSKSWWSIIEKAKNSLKEDVVKDLEKVKTKVDDDIKFWFLKERYSPEDGAPVRSIKEIYKVVHGYSNSLSHTQVAGKGIISALSSCCERIIKILNNYQDEEKITQLILEKIINRVMSADSHIAEPEAYSQAYINKPGNILSEVPEVYWFNFTDIFDPVSEKPFFRNEEIKILEEKGVNLFSPLQRQTLENYYLLKPLYFSKKLVLIQPNSINGESTENSRLYNYIQEVVDDISIVTANIDDAQKVERLILGAGSNRINVPTKVEQQSVKLPGVVPLVEITNPEKFQWPKSNYYSNLEKLIYYPHEFVMSQLADINPNSITNLDLNFRLQGNIAHRIIEIFLEELKGKKDLTEEKITDWFDEKSNEFLAEEGSIFLLKGKEREKALFLKKVKEAVICLVDNIQKNGWSVFAIEDRRESEIDGIKLTGKIDLVLDKGNAKAIIDQKWDGFTKYVNNVKDDIDIQLLIYSFLLGGGTEWPDTAYFIIGRKYFITRDNRIINNALTLSEDTPVSNIYPKMWEKLALTIRWRKERLNKGLIDINKEETYELIAKPDDNCFQMKKEDDKYDNYTTFFVQ
jgi:hypothetical protein